MYRVIIADDEESIRNRLLSMMEKLGDDFEVVGCFENGADTSESGVLLEPDIVITDIRMPYVSGMELIKGIKNELPLVQTVIVSGYDTFDYAKEAIDLGVVAFLTKPIMFEEFKAAMEKAKQVLDNILSFDRNLKNLQEKAQNSLGFIQSDDLNKLMSLKEVPKNLEDRFKEDEINLNGRYQMVVIFDCDDDDLSYEQQDIFHVYVEKYFREEFREDIVFYPFLRESRFVALVENDSPINVEKFVNRISEIIAKVRRNCRFSISCGISDMMEKPVNYRKLYRHAKRSLEYRTVMGQGLVLYYPDLEKSDNPKSKSGKIDENEFLNITYLVSYGKREDALKKTSDIIEAISSPSYKDNYYFYLNNVMNAILKSCLSLSTYYKTVESQIETSNRLYSLKSRESVIEFFHAMIDDVIRINEKQRLSGLQSSYERIKKYLEANFTNPSLSIDDVANELCYSISYISAILKKNETSFTKMTTELRMRRAIELLGDNQNHIITVAKMTGYSDPYYFSHCFKKYTGMSPDEYRKKHTS